MTHFALPDDFQIPLVFETDRFRLRMLRIEDASKDFEAVMSSREHLHSIFGPYTDWPTSALTLEQNLEEIRWHQKEFEQHSSFAYTVVALDESVCLGCVYIYPLRQSKAGFDAQVYLWARQGASGAGLDQILLATVKSWIAQVWPFQKVALPGREIDWSDWKALGCTYE